MTVALVERDIHEREHLLFPDETHRHLNCRACGPGPLGRGQIPSAYNHVFYKTDRELRVDDYGGRWHVEVRKECSAEAAQVVSSEIDDRRGFHTPMLDIDIPSRLVESSTPGHSHLYIDMEMSWRKYRFLLWALMKVGLIEKNYYKVSVKRKGTHLRPPWSDKTI